MYKQNIHIIHLPSTKIYEGYLGLQKIEKMKYVSSGKWTGLAHFYTIPC